MLGESHLVMGLDRQVFMHHAYNALFQGQAREWPPDLRARIVAEVAQDLCSLVRTMHKDFRDEFLRDVTSQVRVS
jgi:hypothetical protein